MKKYVDLFRRAAKAVSREISSLKPTSWNENQEEALAIWRKWLLEEDPMAVWSLSILGREGLELRDKEKAYWVMRSMDFRKILETEWQKVAELGTRELDKLRERSEEEATMMTVTLAISMADGISNGVSKAINFNTWLALWKISPQLGLAKLGDGGFNAVFPSPSEEQNALGRAEKERTKNALAVVWGRDEQGNPAAKELILDDWEDVKPLLVSQSKESRLLGLKLLQQKRGIGTAMGVRPN